MKHIKTWKLFNENFDSEKLKVKNEIESLQGFDYDTIVNNMSLSTKLYKQLINEYPLISNLPYKIYPDKLIFNLNIGDYIIFSEPLPTTNNDGTESEEKWYYTLTFQNGEKNESESSYDMIKEFLKSLSSKNAYNTLN